MKMPRGNSNVKKISLSNTEDANVLNDMFEQMTGSKNADVDILIPKILKIFEQLNKFSKLYKLLLGFTEFIDCFKQHNNHFDSIRQFVDNVEKILNDNARINELSLKGMNKDDVNTIYNFLKDVTEVQNIIITSSNLGKYKRYLENKNELKDEFIKREPGLSLTPFSFTKLDLKILWASDDLNNMAKKYILNILHHSYVIGHVLYDTVTSPNIDIKKFSKIIVENIDKLKKILPRCDKAFDIIKKSVELLENKFKDYYRNSVEAENPSIIIENFIIDVSMSQKASASVTNQFRKIIMHMKKQVSNNNDPRVNKLFKILNTQFDLMAKNVPDAKEDEKEDEKEVLIISE